MTIEAQRARCHQLIDLLADSDLANALDALDGLVFPSDPEEDGDGDGADMEAVDENFESPGNPDDPDDDAPEENRPLFA